MIQDKQSAFCKCVLLILAVLLNFAIVEITAAQEVYVQTGFEEFAVGNPPDDWEMTGGDFEVTKDTVKTDKKALAILGGADGDGLAAPIETDNPIVSVEFWIYIEGGARSLNIKVASADNIGENNGAPTSTGTRIWSAFTMEPHGNPLANLKPMNGSTSASSPILKKANLSSPQGTTGTMRCVPRQKKDSPFGTPHSVPPPSGLFSMYGEWLHRAMWTTYSSMRGQIHSILPLIRAKSSPHSGDISRNTPNSNRNGLES